MRRNKRSVFDSFISGFTQKKEAPIYTSEEGVHYDAKTKTIIVNGYDSDKEDYFATLFGQGNGDLIQPAISEEYSYREDKIDRAVGFVAGIFDEKYLLNDSDAKEILLLLKKKVSSLDGKKDDDILKLIEKGGEDIVNRAYSEDDKSEIRKLVNMVNFKIQVLVNAPNWLPMRFRMIEADKIGEWFDSSKGKLSGYRCIFNMQKGLLTREFEWEDNFGRQVKVKIQRLTSMVDRHMAAINYEFTPLNFSGEIEFESSLDGRVVNCGYQLLKE